MLDTYYFYIYNITYNKIERSFAMKKTKTISESKLSGRTWFNLCLFGLIGQIAWNLENMYFNTFMYETVYEKGEVVSATLPYMSAIKWMVGLSAVTAVVTTFIMGNLSDKMNKRKVFISAGYLVWGVVTIAFGFITKENIGNLFNIEDPAKIVFMTSASIIAMDCLMTLIGSTSNDSAFNAWVTDITTTKNRATAESVLAILPIVAMLVVMLSAGMITSFGGGDIAKGYTIYFVALGLCVCLCGVIGLFSLKDSKNGERKPNANYWKDLFYGFRPSVIKENSKLYIALAAVCIYSVAVQIFFPYLLIYLDHAFGIQVTDLLGLLTGSVIAIAVIVVLGVVAGIIGFGKLTDKLGKKNSVLIANALFVIGLIAVGFTHDKKYLLIGAIPLLAGYGLMGILLNSTVRDYTPEDKTGLFQGIRMIFFVLIPMLAGPAIGDAVCKQVSGATFFENGIEKYEPCAEMFIAAGIVAILSFIPIIVLRIKGIDKKED